MTGLVGLDGDHRLHDLALATLLDQPDAQALNQECLKGGPPLGAERDRRMFCRQVDQGRHRDLGSPLHQDHQQAEASPAQPVLVRRAGWLEAGRERRDQRVDAIRYGERHTQV